MLDTSDIKRMLREAGLEVYRAKGSTIHVAERVRENLIMDSGVRIDVQRAAVTFYTRAQRRDFPGESSEQLYARARALGSTALARGFREARSFITEVQDPGYEELTLDHWYQVQYEIAVTSVDDVIQLVRFAFGLEKTAKR